LFVSSPKAGRQAGRHTPLAGSSDSMIRGTSVSLGVLPVAPAGVTYSFPRQESIERQEGMRGSPKPGGPTSSNCSPSSER
jgi:hypothetical protein